MVELTMNRYGGGAEFRSRPHRPPSAAAQDVSRTDRVPDTIGVPYILVGRGISPEGISVGHVGHEWRGTHGCVRAAVRRPAVRASEFLSTVGCELPGMRSERLAWSLDKHDLRERAKLSRSGLRQNGTEQNR
jgi:hypothetical protein